MVTNDNEDLKTEFRLALERAGLTVAQEDEPGLWDQFLQARQHAKALDVWEVRLKETEPSVTFEP